MSEESEVVKSLRDELRVAQELLALVLDYVGEQVVLDVEESKRKNQGDRMIDLQLDDEAGTWTLQLVEINA